MQKLLYITSRPHAHPTACENDGVVEALVGDYAADRLVLTPVAEACVTDATSFESGYLHTFALRAEKNWRSQFRVHGAAKHTLSRTLLDGGYDVIFFDGDDMLDLASACAGLLLTAKVVLRSDRFRLRTNRRHFLRVGSRLEAPEVLAKISAFRPPRLRLGLVTNRFWPEVGGAETNIWFQARELARRHDVTVFCPRRLKETPGRERTEDGITIRRLWDLRNPLRRFPNRASNTFCPGLFLRILFGSFHIVQCFPALNHNNILALLARLLTRRPCLLVSFDFIDYSSIMKQTGRTTGMLDDYRLPDWRAFFLRRFHHVFTISDRETEFVRRYNPSVEYSPVPVETSEYDEAPPSPREKYAIQDDEFVLLMLGRVAHTKGQDIGVQAFARIAADLPDTRLVIVGRSDYEPEFLVGIEKVIAEHGIEDRVIFTGMVEREEALGWLRHAEVHVVPVRFMNSGAVVVESWISGTPVIQSDVVDPNLVREGSNGFLFRSEDVDELAAAMRRSHEARDNLPALAARGEELVREQYTYQALIELYGRRFREVLSDRHCAVKSDHSTGDNYTLQHTLAKPARRPAPQPSPRVENAAVDARPNR